MKLPRMRQQMAAVVHISLAYVLWLPLSYILAIIIAIRYEALDCDHDLRRALAASHRDFHRRWNKGK
jgi:hypothetical protein